jgi:agmatinase
MSQDSIGFGFGGFPVVPFDQIPDRGNRRTCLYGVDIDISRCFGESNSGAASFLRKKSARMVPKAVRQQRLDWLKGIGMRPDKRLFEGYDIGLLTGTNDEVAKDAALLGASLVERNYFPALIGCDHTAGYWHALGVSRVKEVTYVYLDAHLDVGLHRGQDKDTVDNGNFVASFLRGNHFQEVVNIGARAWSTYSSEYDAIPSLRLIRYSNMAECQKEIEILRGRAIYVSIDADVIDPCHFPNVTCPEPFGLSPQTLLIILQSLFSSCEIVGADLCELKADESRTHTAEVALRFLYELAP